MLISRQTIVLRLNHWCHVNLSIHPQPWCVKFRRHLTTTKPARRLEIVSQTWPGCPASGTSGCCATVWVRLDAVQPQARAIRGPAPSHRRHNEAGLAGAGHAQHEAVVRPAQHPLHCQRLLRVQTAHQCRRRRSEGGRRALRVWRLCRRLPSSLGVVGPRDGSCLRIGGLGRRC